MPWQREWTGNDSEGVYWKVEIDTDLFNDVDPFVVAVFIEESEKGSAKAESAMATLSPEQARELAASLLREADNCQSNRDRVAA